MTDFPNYPTPHCHCAASLDTASTPESFAKWEVEHETDALTVTDHGTLAGVRKVYDIAHSKAYKGKLTPILGIEAYLRDDDDPILRSFGVPKSTRYRKPGTDSWKDQEAYDRLEAPDRALYEPEQGYWDYLKYTHLTVHFLDLEAHDAACKLFSRLEEERTERHGKERKPLLSWADLEHLGGYNVTFGSGCLIGAVQRHLAFGAGAEVATAYYERLRGVVKPGNFYVEVFPHVCDRNWDSAVVLTFADGTTRALKSWKRLRTDRHADGKGVKAEYFVDQWAKWHESGERLLAVMEQREWVAEAEPKVISSVEHVEKFILNDCTAFSPDGDLQLPCNRFVMGLAEKYGDKVLPSDDSHFALPEDKVVQDVKLLQSGDWRFATSYHRMSSAETWPYFRDKLGQSEAQFAQLVENSREWAARFRGFKFRERQSLPTRFYPEKTLEHTWEICQRHGRHELLRKPEYLERFRTEVELLHSNGTVDLLPYFFVGEDVCRLYTRHGWLTGPGRGSAAGLLLAYLERITHVDPLRYGLSRDRFMTLDRVKSRKMPDIDQDLPHRELLVDESDSSSGWLRWRFGDCAVQISTDMTIKLRKACQAVCKMTSPDKRVPPEVVSLTSRFQDAPMGISDRDFVFGYKDGAGVWVTGSIEYDEALVLFTKKYPKEWEVVQRCLGIPFAKGRHACAYLISNDPIGSWIPTTIVNGARVTQPTAAQVEAMGGLKMDFLVVNSLRDIGSCIRLIQQRSSDRSQPWEDAYRGQQMRYKKLPDGTWQVPDLPDDPLSVTVNGLKVPLIQVVPHRGEYLDVWDLPEDQAVFREICEGSTDSVFQLSTPGAKKWLRHFDHLRPGQWAPGQEHKAIDSIQTLAAFTALDRPGPLDARVTDPDTKKDHNMLVEFARRAAGKKPVGNFPILDQLFPETYGILVFQEALQKAFQDLGGTDGIAANNFRIHVSKKQPMEIAKDREVFMRGAVEKIGKEQAEILWSTMETFGQYGFNASHAVCYVVIAYACAWLKKHYPLEWWTSVLQHAAKDEVTEKFWPCVGHLLDMPDVRLSGDNYQIVGDKIRAPINLLKGVAEKAHEELRSYQPILSVEDLCQKVKARKATGARSALHSGVMQTLIVGGACDGLFEPGLPVPEQLAEYFRVYCAVNGEVYKVGPRRGQQKRHPDKRLLELNALQRYQYKKQVLPAFSADLRALLGLPRPKVPSLSWYGTTLRYDTGTRKLDVVRAADLAQSDILTLWPKGHTVDVVVAAYVSGQEFRRYHGDKEMMKLSLDVEGDRRELVMWPDRESGALPERHVRSEYAGSIALVRLRKWSAERDFSVEDVEVVSPPLSKVESSPTPSAGEEQ